MNSSAGSKVFSAYVFILYRLHIAVLPPGPEPSCLAVRLVSMLHLKFLIQFSECVFCDVCESVFVAYRPNVYVAM